MRFLAACIAALLPIAVQAQAQDPLKSPECAQALEELNAARAAQPPDTARAETLRKAAARACLGLTEEARPSGRAAQAPLRVPSPVITPPRRPAIAEGPVIAPEVIKRPPVLTSCDPGGCWDSNGTRLNRAGPNLIGPGGVCSQHGAFLNCP